MFVGAGFHVESRGEEHLEQRCAQFFPCLVVSINFPGPQLTSEEKGGVIGMSDS